MEAQTWRRHHPLPLLEEAGLQAVSGTQAVRLVSGHQLLHGLQYHTKLEGETETKPVDEFRPRRNKSTRFNHRLKSKAAYTEVVECRVGQPTSGDILGQLVEHLGILRGPSDRQVSSGETCALRLGCWRRSRHSRAWPGCSWAALLCVV